MQKIAIKSHYTDQETIQALDDMGAHGAHAALLRCIAHAHARLKRCKLGSAKYVAALAEWRVLCGFADGSYHALALYSGEGVPNE